MLTPILPTDYAVATNEEDCLSVRRVRAQNDALRLTGYGGIIVESFAVKCLPEITRRSVFTAIQAFDSFNEDNDPWGEHDCAVIEVDGADYLFKIDYYDRKYKYHSPDKTNFNVTARLLTICTTDER